MNNNEELMKGVETYYGAGQISEVMASTIKRIYQQANEQLPPEVRLSRMALDPFKISAQVALNKPVILSITIPSLNKFRVTTSLILPKNFPHTSTTWQISLDGNFDAPAVNIPSTTNTVVFSIPITKIDYETDYYFRVQHHSGALASPWSDIVKLTTAPPVPITKPVVLTGIQDEENEELITLTSSTYQHIDLIHEKSVWQVSKTSDFAIIALEAEDTTAPLTGVALTVPNIESDTNYYFRVKYVSGKYSSAWSNGFLIKTLANETIEKPSVILDTPICPINFIVGGSPFTPSNPEMLHTATTYEVATSTDFETTTIYTITTDVVDELTTIQLPDTTCEEDTEYFIRLKYTSDLIESEWSDIVNTTTGHVIVSKPKKVALPAIALDASDSGYCKFLNVDGVIYSLFEDVNNKFSLNTYDPVTKTSTPKNTSPYTWTEDHIAISDKDGIYLFLKHPTFFSIEKYDPIANTWSTVTTTTSTLTLDIPNSAMAITSKAFYIFHADPSANETPSLLAYTVIDRNTLTWSPGTTIDDREPKSASYLAANVIQSSPSSVSIILMNKENSSTLYVLTYVDLLDINLRRVEASSVNWGEPNESYNFLLDILIDTSYNKTRAILIQQSSLIDGTIAYQYTEGIHNGEYMVWTPLSSVPGVAEFDNPSFVLKGNTLYVIAKDKGRFLKPVVNFSEKFTTTIGPNVFQTPKALFMEGDYIYALSFDESDYIYTLIKVSKNTPATVESFKLTFDALFYTFSTHFYHEGYLYFGGGFRFDDTVYTNVSHTKLFKYHIATATMSLESSSCPIFKLGTGCGYGDSLYFIGGQLVTEDTAVKPRKYNLTTKAWTLDLMSDATVLRNNMQLCPIPGQGIVCYNGKDLAFPNGLVADQLRMHYLWNVDTNALVELGQHGNSPDRPVMFLVNDIPTTIDWYSYENHRFMMYQRDTVNGGYNFWKGIDLNYSYTYVTNHQSDLITHAVKDGNYLYILDKLIDLFSWAELGENTDLCIMRLDLTADTYTIHHSNIKSIVVRFSINPPVATRPYTELDYEIIINIPEASPDFFLGDDAKKYFKFENNTFTSIRVFPPDVISDLGSGISYLGFSVGLGSKENSWSPMSDIYYNTEEIPPP